MSDLERRCRRLARAYPRGPRADEVLTTLLESNEGRDRPRLADTLNVLWHGLATRMGDRSAGTRFGPWGDAAVVAVVMLTLLQVLIVGSLVPASSGRLPRALAVVAALAALLTAWAAGRGKVRLSRAGAAVTAPVGIATVLLVRAADPDGLIPGPWAALVALVLVGVALAMLLTSSVSRAVAIPRRWGGIAGNAWPFVVALVVDAKDGVSGSEWMGVALTSYTALVWMLLVVGLPWAPEHRVPFRGVVLVAALTAPWGVASLADGMAPFQMGLVVLTVWAGLVALVAVASRVTPAFDD